MKMILCLALVSVLPPYRLSAQSWRVLGWASYESVSSASDWSTYGGQVTWATRRGDAVWASVEAVNRFDVQDGVEKLGGVLHPTPRLWLTLEAGTAAGPEVVPRNSWELDVSGLATGTTAAGLGYRRLNYPAGPVDVVMPHLTVQLARTSWDARVFVSRNPSRRTDAAFSLRAARAISARAMLWLGVGAGRESYLVGAPPSQTVQSLKTVTGLAGGRLVLGRTVLARLDATVVSSEPVLSRRGVAISVERRF